MSDSLLEDYKAYYAVRAEKYAGNPNYPNYYEAEKRLSDAMQSCAVLEEFRDKIGDLNERCASALIKDQYILEQKHFEKHKEIIRVLLSKRILEKVDNYNNVNDLITMVTEESTKNMVEISLDEANRFFVSDWEYVDAAEVYSNAVVPDKYKADMQRWAGTLRKSMSDGAKDLEKSMDAFQKGWKLNPDVVTEYRHRRLLPYTDEQIREQMERFKKIINT
jgi:hypothetical protein